MFKMMKKDEGFTLVELMVVVLIIGILVAIAIPIFNNASEQAQIRTCDANVRTIDGAINQAAAVEGVNPNALDSAENPIASVQDLVDANYLKELPECPFEDAYAIGADGFVTPHTHP